MRNKSGIDWQKKHCHRTHDFHHPSCRVVRASEPIEHIYFIVENLVLCQVRDNRLCLKQFQGGMEYSISMLSRAESWRALFQTANQSRSFGPGFFTYWNRCKISLCGRRQEFALAVCATRFNLAFQALICFLRLKICFHFLLDSGHFFFMQHTLIHKIGRYDFNVSLVQHIEDVSFQFGTGWQILLGFRQKAGYFVANRKITQFGDMDKCFCQPGFPSGLLQQVFNPLVGNIIAKWKPVVCW